MSDKQAAYRCRHPPREPPAQEKTTSGSDNRPAYTHRASCRSIPNAPAGAHTSCPDGCPLPEGSRSRASTKTISPFSSFPFFAHKDRRADVFYEKISENLRASVSRKTTHPTIFSFHRGQKHIHSQPPKRKRKSFGQKLPGVCFKRKKSYICTRLI